MSPKKASSHQNRKRKLERLLELEKCTKISSFFKSNTNSQDFNMSNVTSERELKDNSNEFEMK